MTVSRLCDVLEIQFPLLQAGMGGIAGDALTGAVSEAGAAGVLGLFRMRPQQISELVVATSKRTSKAFGVNLIPELVSPAEIADQIDAAMLASRPNVFFVFYGMPGPDAAHRIIKGNRKFLVKLGDARAISTAESLGAAAVVLQGIEAGGHLLGECTLEELILRARDGGCRLPIVVAGGISLGNEFRRYESFGASGCMCGTLFAATNESRAHPIYKQRLVDASSEHTVITGRYNIGWPNRAHRVLCTATTEESVESAPANFIGSTRIGDLRFPIPRFSAFAPDDQTQGHVEEMAMYAGTSVNGVRDIVDARVRVERFITQYNSEATRYS